MGVEVHSYGNVLCGLLSRRSYVQLACFIAFGISLLQLVGWCIAMFLAPDETGSRVRNCVGTECYEVWTCRGMRATTEHMREPLLWVIGVAVFFWCFLGARYGSHSQLKAGGKGLLCMAIVYAVSCIFDFTYYELCGAYSTNIVKGTLTSDSRLPPSPLMGGNVITLRGMEEYPAAEVDALTGGYNVLLWYGGIATGWTVFLFYTAYHARFLSELVERGPLGLGVNYGLGQWDEIINHDAVRIFKDKSRRSAFIDDAQLPLSLAGGREDTIGYRVTMENYGAAEAARLAEQKGVPHIAAGQHQW